MLLLALLATLVMSGVMCEDYFGTYVGSFATREHRVQGDVYVVDSRTLYIKGFSYDGQGPDAFFYAGELDGGPDESGYIVPDENGSKDVLGRYDAKDLVLTLPSGRSVRDLKWLSVWCRAFAVNFGEINVKKQAIIPRPQRISSFMQTSHGVKSGRLVVVDAQTLLVPDFSYDGAAPDAHFWVGKGGRPGTKGYVVADENGSSAPLRRYDSKTLVLVLPNELTIFDIDWISVWCVAFAADFGHVPIPAGLQVPPSLKMLGVRPQTKLNCEVLDRDKGFEVRWAVAGRSIVTQLVAKLASNEYMAFGLSGSPTRSQMLNGDVTVAWMDENLGQGFAEDYTLNDLSQCVNDVGVCPDTRIKNGRNNVRLLNSAFINDFSMITFRRPLRSRDDLLVASNQSTSQPVIWAMGPINEQNEASYHTRRLEGDLFLDFGRVPQWNCPVASQQRGQQQRVEQRGRTSSAPRATSSDLEAWFVPAVGCAEPADGVLFAQIGPTGGQRGYGAITGHVGWGIAWYINGLLIPELHLVRGKTYTFVVEGGNDPDQPAKFHPLYITDDPQGGLSNQNARIFAGGPDQFGRPEATGRICEWKQDPNRGADQFESFAQFQRSLRLDCQDGEPGVLQWTPDENTPDLVYYQCVTHRHLGWKIHVHDSCDN